MSVTITQRFEFDAAHRLPEHSGKCHYLHGHRYMVEVELEGQVNDEGMVLDFGQLNRSIGHWLDSNVDHTTIVGKHDQELQSVLVAAGQRLCILPVWPTAEGMAEFFGTNVFPPLVEDQGVVIVRVTVWETPRCSATWRLNP